MNLTRDRVRSIGWAAVLTVCAGLTAGLTLRVNAVKSEVHDAESRIVRLQRDIVFLETEFKTRANQQQLKALNDIEFGYSAPRAEQYIEGERQLAALGKPRGPGAPQPIRVAQAVTPDRPGGFMAMVSASAGTDGDTGETQAPAAPNGAPQKPSPAPAAKQHRGDPVGSQIDASSLGERLSRIDARRNGSGSSGAATDGDGGE